jgi:hypothetical protein
MDDVLNSLNQLISDKELANLEKITMFKEDDGSYMLYGRYIVKKVNTGDYTVSVIGTFTEKTFHKLKNAVAWCSFDKRRLIKEANRLHFLDQKIFDVEIHIEYYSSLIKKSKNTDNKVVYLSKLSQDKTKRHMFTEDLNKYIKEYQRWQNNVFNTKPGY